MGRENYHREVSPVAVQRTKEDKCPNCGKPKSEWKRRTDWSCCSVECTSNYYKEFDKSISWEQFRYNIFKRDGGRCAMCGSVHLRWSEGAGVMVPVESELIADHVVPIELGGGMWDTGNVQTLCVSCNKVKTRLDM